MKKNLSLFLLGISLCLLIGFSTTKQEIANRYIIVSAQIKEELFDLEKGTTLTEERPVCIRIDTTTGET